jgi:DNA-binding MurR/RpiR family transcriptional regulator
MTRHDDLTEVLRRDYPQLSRAQQRVARVILDDTSSVAYTSAGELAERAGVHAATVVRLSQRLGYDGYPDLQKDLRTKLSQYPTFLQRLERGTSPSDPAELVARTFAHTRRNLELAARSVDVAALEHLVAGLDACRRTVVLGMGVARPVVSYLASCLCLAGIDTHEPADTIAMAQQLGLTDQRDVVILIDFHRYYRELVQLAGVARDSGAVVVALTDSPVSDLAPYAHHLLVVPSEGTAPRTSLAPAMVLTEAILALLVAVRRPAAQTTMRRIDDIYTRANTFTT